MQTIREQLEALAEPDYRAFSSRLLPGVDNLLGVRLPALRRLSGRIARQDWRRYLDQAEDFSFEEILLQGMVIGAAAMPHAERRAWTAAFVSKIDNWSVCDSFCAGLKAVRQEPEAWWTFLLPYVKGTDEYGIRFGVVMLLLYYLDEARLPAVLELLAEVVSPGPAARSAVAWAAAECYLRFPGPTGTFLENGGLDPLTLRATLRKIGESRRADDTVKAWVRAWRRKLDTSPAGGTAVPDGPAKGNLPRFG